MFKKYHELWHLFKNHLISPMKMCSRSKSKETCTWTDPGSPLGAKKRRERRRVRCRPLMSHWSKLSWHQRFKIEMFVAERHWPNHIQMRKVSHRLHTQMQILLSSNHWVKSWTADEFLMDSERVQIMIPGTETKQPTISHDCRTKATRGTSEHHRWWWWWWWWWGIWRPGAEA